MSAEEGIERILVVGAHPDDCDFGSAGTVAQWTAQGIAVSYLVVTDGDVGGYDRSIPREQIPGMRRKEQEEAGKILGVTDLHFLGYPDGKLTVSLELRRDITRVVRKLKPQRIVTHSPERSWQFIGASHPDHMAVGEATLCAVYPDARNPFAYPELIKEGLEPHTVSEVWIAGGEPPNRVIDVTDVWPKKIEALRKHESQFENFDQLIERMSMWHGMRARNGGLRDGRMAETFRSMVTS